MDIREPDFNKVTIYLDYLMLIDKKLDTYGNDERTKKDLEAFYNMVFNLAYYEIALLYAGAVKESEGMISDYIKKLFKKDKDDKGGLDGGFKL